MHINRRSASVGGVTLAVGAVIAATVAGSMAGPTVAGIPATPPPTTITTEPTPAPEPTDPAPETPAASPSVAPSTTASTSSTPRPSATRKPSARTTAVAGTTRTATPTATTSAPRKPASSGSAPAASAPPSKAPAATMRYTSSITPAQGGVTIKDGWNGTRVYLVRKHFGIDGPTSKLGTYDTATKARVLAFQKERGLPATGHVDEATWNALDTGYPWTIDAYQVKPKLPTSAGAAQRTDTMIEFALAQRGSRYAWGGAGPYELGFDCSGLVLQALYAAGYDPQPINVVKHAEPTYRTSGELYRHQAFESVPINDRQRGDLIFFGNKAGVVHHVAIYLGDGTMMESYGDTAAIRKYSPQYGSSYVLPYAKRVFR